MLDPGPTSAVDRASLTLTPDEIDRREFPIEFRGYDRASVSEFLHDVALNYTALLAEARRLLELSRQPAAAAAPPEGAAAVSTTPPEEARAIIDAAVELSTRIVAAGQEDRLRSAAEGRRILDAARAEARELVDRARDYQAVLARAEDDLRRPEAAPEPDLLGLWGVPPTAPAAPPHTAPTRTGGQDRGGTAGHLHIAWPPAQEQSPRQAG